MTDLLQAFDCLPHNLLMAKLDVYGFKNYAFYDKKCKKRKNKFILHLFSKYY